MGLEVGLLDYKSIIKWADCIIEDSEAVHDDFLFDLSLSGSSGINEVIKILKSNESRPNHDLVWQTLYGLIAIKFQDEEIDLKRGCYAVSEVANQAKNETEYDLFGMSLDDSFYLASRGITGNLEETKKVFLNYTNPFIELGRTFINQELKN